MRFSHLERKVRLIAASVEAFRNKTLDNNCYPTNVSVHNPVILTESAGEDPSTATANVFGTTNKTALMLANTVYQFLW